MYTSRLILEPYISHISQQRENNSPENCKRAREGRFILCEDLTLVHPIYGEMTTKAGFVTDLASIPGIARGIIERSAADIIRPAVTHDDIFTRKGINCFSKKPNLTFTEANLLLVELMKYEQILLGYSINELKSRRDMVFSAVELGGYSHWKD